VAVMPMTAMTPVRTTMTTVVPVNVLGLRVGKIVLASNRRLYRHVRFLSTGKVVLRRQHWSCGCG
jgi:hypothetical protein